MERRDWKNLIRDIQHQRCVLMLGPSLACSEYENEWIPINEIFALHLSKELKEEGVKFEKEHRRNLTYIAQKFLTIPNVRRTDLEDEVIYAYKQYIEEIPPIYHVLAQYPFHIIINTTPDDFMLRALQIAGKHYCTHTWYNFRKNHEPEVGNISSETPLVYNLFGSLQDPEALVLTEQDQVDFIKNIVLDEPPVPSKIMSQFDERKTYLFLEFDLRNWQFRLLFDGLNLHKENKSFIPQFSKAVFNTPTKEYYESCFNFNFIKKDTSQFTKELKEKFKTAQSIDENINTKTQKVFISFDLEDEKNYLIPLVKVLRPFEQKSYIKIWHRGMITPGTNQKTEIALEMNKANVILLLLSADFLANDNLYEGEVQQALGQLKQRKSKIIPILARSCSWEQTEFAHLPMLPDNQKPINENEFWGSPDFAYENIVNGFKRMIL